MWWHHGLTNIDKTYNLCYMCILKKKSKPIFMPNGSIIYATFCFVPNCSAPSKQIQYIHCLKTSAFITSLSIYRESWNGPLSSFKHDWSHENPSIPSCTAVTATGWLSPLTDRFQGVFWPRRAFHPPPPWNVRKWKGGWISSCPSACSIASPPWRA